MKVSSLPVPSLLNTKKELEKRIKPLVSEQIYQEFLLLSSQFFGEHGEAHLLNKKLIEWKKKHPENWLIPLWEDMYLTYRDPLHTGMNFSILLNNREYKNRYTLSELTSRVMILSALFYKKIIKGEFTTSESEDGLCSNQYKNIFRSMRIPRKYKDEYIIHPLDDRKLFFIVFHNHRMYQVYVSDLNGSLFSEKIINSVIKRILNRRDHNSINPSILTTANREVAAEIYAELEADKQNKELCNLLSESLAFINLDLESRTIDEIIYRLFVGSDNKYFDKTLQITVTSDHYVGINGEHTGVDGTSMLTYIEFLNKHISCNVDYQISEEPYCEERILTWKIEPYLQNRLEQLRQINELEIKRYYVSSRSITSINAKDIKNKGLSPDGFFHSVLQIVQSQIFNKINSTYEPVSMRKYKFGRTECVRPSTIENLLLAEAFNDYAEDEIVELIKKSQLEHKRQIDMCLKGQGVERHLFGLERMFDMFNDELILRNRPELFKNIGYQTLKCDFLSTSNNTNSQIIGGAFGPVEENGYGIFYSLLDERIDITITSMVENSTFVDDLLNRIEEVMNRLINIYR